MSRTTRVLPTLPPDPAPTADVARSAAPAWAVDDCDLRCRVAARDPHAFAQGYQHYAPRLRRYLQRRLPPQVLPEDVLHEIWLLVWHHGVRCAPNTSLGAWLFGIARRATRPRPGGAWAAAGRTTAVLEGALVQHELTHALRQAVAALPPAERQVVEWTYYHDLSYPEIAAIVECPVNTVKARMARARQRLAPQLGALALALAPDAADPCVPHHGRYHPTPTRGRR